MERKVLEFIRENELLSRGDEVTVALSGGADSVALLWCLRKLAPELGIRLQVAHFHHGLRGPEADRDAEFCAGLCRRWEIPFRLGRGDAAAEAARTGRSLEEAARVLRYAFLEQAAAGLIATAHNADDNVETLLMHLLRGTGIRGLGGIPPRRDRVIRPLLRCTREEILALLDREGLPHVEDSTNAADDCLRNRLRHRVIPLLRQENPNLAGTVARTAALVRAEDRCLSRMAAEAAAGCRAGEGWSVSRLLGLDPVLRGRLLTSVLRDLGLEDPSEVLVRSLERLLRAGPSARIDLPGGNTARREYDLLLFSPPPQAPEDWSVPLIAPGTTALPGGLGKIVCSVTKNLYFSQKNLNTFALKCDMILQHTCQLRSRRPGDRLTLPGGTKTLKALMIDRKIPARRRTALPVLTADGRILAVPGLAADRTALAAPGEPAVLVEFFPGEGFCASPNREEEVNE